MIEEFPILKEGEVALSRADINTGIVLDEDCNYALNLSQKVYTVFDNKVKALIAAKKLITEKPATECYIHSAPGRLVYFLNSTELKSFDK